MAVNADGRVDILPIQQQSRLLDTPEQREEYADIREDLNTALELGQQLGKAQLQLRALLDALPEDFSSALVRSVWRTGNRLRRTYEAHMATLTIDEYHEARLEPEAAAEIGNILDTFNNFAFVDPNLRERDLRRVPPQSRNAIHENLEQAKPIIADALSENLATDAAEREVTEELENASNAAEGVHDDQAVEQADLQTQNFLSAALSGAVGVVKNLKRSVKAELKSWWKDARSGAYQTSGAALIGLAGTEAAGLTTYHIKLVDLIVRNAEALKIYATSVFNNPSVTAAIDFIVKLFS